MHNMKLWIPLFGVLMLMTANLASAQSNMMMDNGMMMSGWAMLVCIVFGVLLFVALVLSILALLKYLFRS